MSDYSNGETCPECGCTMMDGTHMCWACGYGTEAWEEDEEESEQDQ